MEIPQGLLGKCSYLFICEMRKYFENLMKPLVTNESLEELLSSSQQKTKDSKKNTMSKKKKKIGVNNSIPAKCFKKA